MANLDRLPSLSNHPTSVLRAAVVERRPLPIPPRKKTSERSTNELIKVITHKCEDSILRRVECAMAVRELWERVDAGKMGLGVKWYSWARDNINLGKTQLKGHMRVARSPNPRAEAERLWDLRVARAQRLEERFINETGVEKSTRENLKRFAKYGPIEKVMRIYEIRCQMYR
jgi:hypothetical protein